MSRKHAKWARWLESIRADLDRLARWHDAHQQATQRETFAQDALVFEEIYLHAIAIGIRRQLKLGSRAISLARLLEDMASSADTTIHPATVRHDLAALRRVARPAESYADRVVAHLDRRSATPPTHEDIARALATLDRLHAKYTALR